MYFVFSVSIYVICGANIYNRLNQCVGELNHKYFMLFLMVNSAFFIYATYVVSLVLLSEIYERDLMNAVFYNHITGEVTTIYFLRENELLFEMDVQ